MPPGCPHPSDARVAVMSLPAGPLPLLPGVIRWVDVVDDATGHVGPAFKRAARERHGQAAVDVADARLPRQVHEGQHGRVCPGCRGETRLFTRICPVGDHDTDRQVLIRYLPPSATTGFFVNSQTGKVRAQIPHLRARGLALWLDMLHVLTLHRPWGMWETANLVDATKARCELLL